MPLHQPPATLSSPEPSHDDAPCPSLMIEPLVRAALLEDLGRAGDLTTEPSCPADASAATRARRRASPACVAGPRRGVAAPSGCSIPAIEVRVERPGRQRASQPGDRIADDRGPAARHPDGRAHGAQPARPPRGIATATATLVEAVQGHKARIACTRKTTPGLRALEKYAVRAGGGVNHRFGLDDAVLIKDNHVAAAGGVGAAIERARAQASATWSRSRSRSTPWSSSTRRYPARASTRCCSTTWPRRRCARRSRMIAGRAITEASGGITPAPRRRSRPAGVDLISAGWLTHSAPVLDIGLDWRHASTGAEGRPPESAYLLPERRPP